VSHFRACQNLPTITQITKPVLWSVCIGRRDRVRSVHHTDARGTQRLHPCPSFPPVCLVNTEVPILNGSRSKPQYSTTFRIVKPSYPSASIFRCLFKLHAAMPLFIIDSSGDDSTNFQMWYQFMAFCRPILGLAYQHTIPAFP